MLYCQYCGNPNRDDARFCSKCGSSLDTGMHDTPADEQPENPYAGTHYARIQKQPENPYAYKPTPAPQQPFQPMPATYLWQAIVVTALCCPPFGIPAIVFAAQVQSRYQSGDIEGALNASKKARNFSIWALITGIIVNIISFFIGFGSALLDYL